MSSELKPPIVCGKQLQPFTSKHLWMLKLLNNAFTSNAPDEPGAGDLLIGVLVCSMDLKNFAAFAASPDFQEKIFAWGRQFGFFPPKCFSWPLIGKWLSKRYSESVKIADAVYLADQIRIFRLYVHDGLTKRDGE